MARFFSFIWSTACFPSSVCSFKKRTQNTLWKSKVLLQKNPTSASQRSWLQCILLKDKNFSVSIFENFKWKSKFALVAGPRVSSLDVVELWTQGQDTLHQSWHSSEQPEWTELKPWEITERLTCIKDDLQTSSSKALQRVWAATKWTEPWQSIQWAAQI